MESAILNNVFLTVEFIVIFVILVASRIFKNKFGFGYALASVLACAFITQSVLAGAELYEIGVASLLFAIPPLTAYVEVKR